MSPLQILSLLLALSVALHVGVAAAFFAHRTRAGITQAGRMAAVATATVLGIYLAGVAAYR
ncbi:hypothetical protein ACFUTV_40815 [Streptomyces sp. NPDC057298]|uniref:hypothetical protein n=1 Tax=Streptomyces sp. NPDC057298 TaxID=3346091 RepID=UPI00362E1EA2